MTPVKLPQKQVSVKTNKDGVSFVAVTNIEVEEGFNVRKKAQADDALVESVKNNQIVNPLHVRIKGNRKDKFFLVDGERRLDAALKAGLGSVPVVNHGKMTDKDALVISLTANENQKRLTKKEMLEGFKKLRREGMTVPQIAKIMGVEKRLVDETMRVDEKASPKLKKETKKEPKKGGISTRVAARAATLPKKEQDKLVPKLKGKSREEGLKKVREVEKKIGVTKPGKKAEPKKIQSSVSSYSIAPDAADRCRMLEKIIRNKLKLVGGQHRALNAQLLIVECIKGNGTPQEIFGWDNI